MSGNQYKISVIIPIYNSEKYIEECAISLFDQDMEGIEYIFINDCSTDGGLLKLKGLIQHQYLYLKDNIRIISLSRNTGIANVRNIGLANAKSDYVAFCDSDDWIEPNMYSSLYDCAINNKSDVVACDFYNEYSNWKTIHNQCYDSNREANLVKLLTGELFPSLWCELVKKEIYLNHNIYFLPDLNMGEDLIVNIKIFSSIRKFSYVNLPMYHYRHSDTSSCVIRSLISVNSEILIAKHIEDYLRQKGLYDMYKLEINYRKFISKSPLWSMKEYRNINLWKNTYKETNKYILSYKWMDWKMKMEFWLVANHMSFLAVSFVHLLKMQSFLKQFR